MIKIKFSTKARKCRPSYASCTTSIVHRRRTLTVRPHEQYLALQARRQRQKTKEFATTYAQRAGVEGTMAQGVYWCGMRRSRSMGQACTHLQHLGAAAAINVIRVIAWLEGIPLAKTRISPFAALMKRAA